MRKRKLKKKVIMKWEYLNVTWPMSSYLLTYLRLFIDIHWTGSSLIRHKVNLIQLKTFELEFRTIYTVHWCADCGSLLGSLYSTNWVTSYLRLLALPILTCSTNMSFLARLVLDNSRSLEKIELGHCPPSHPLRKISAQGLSSRLCCALDFNS